jgi:nucleoside-diphosphate-sugar epimerase
MSTPISPTDGPVAVTGSAGYIGSHIVLNLVKHGYTVRACVRDIGNLANTAHLIAMNSFGPGRVELFACDMTDAGAYDDVFRGSCAVFHAAAEMGNWQREGNDLSMRSKWSPHTYPVIDPALKEELK